MFSTIRSLYYLASEAAYIPVRLAQALGEGIALGWRTANPSGAEGVTITYGSAYREPQTSPTDGVVSADPTVGERPAQDSAILPAACAGHPKLALAAATGLSMWIRGEPCTAPTYFASIADDLEQLSK